MTSPSKLDENCLFCKIVRGEIAAPRVFEDENSLAFLDHRPLFPGHSLLIPKDHLQTLSDLPPSLMKELFSNVQLLATATQHAMNAEGTLVAINNRVSQSVPHFHVHVVPRRKGDGLKGFFWPRSKYKNEEQIAEVVSALRGAIAQLQSKSGTGN